MKKRKSTIAIVVICIILLLIAAYLLYSRPMTIQERYPMLTLDKCTELRGYYKIAGQTELTEFTIDKNSEAFEMLCSLLYEQDYHRSLRDLLPSGTRYHATEPDDFEWEVFSHFEDVEFPDGSISSGPILRVQIWYGELDIHFDGEILSCRTKEQETWAKEVLNIIKSVPA
ncbi:MAG: hypothetical protein IKK78_04235 [Oscillospiraceae bacterium]|nr:hypothetical protein [Oscillospiraceae bacterium]